MVTQVSGAESEAGQEEDGGMQVSEQGQPQGQDVRTVAWWDRLPTPLRESMIWHLVIFIL